ncbi:hypothetical protein [Bacillus sp. 005/A4HT-01/001]|uniref:hypothetical protein n=1 Tax=Bacillus sp. 005/A4HT-01/001 TaxID=2509010 RepID=UPI001F10F769|nr:hypothetical protein [Bacillus sp. 005/A4HT-01/001]
MNETAGRAEQKKAYVLKKGNDLTGSAPVIHDLWRTIVPIAREFDKRNVDIGALYSYLLAYTNGQTDNNWYMAAFTSVDTIASDLMIGRNRINHLSKVLEAVGLLETAYNYAGRKKNKLYYPQYYSTLTPDEMRANLRELYSKPSVSD